MPKTAAPLKKFKLTYANGFEIVEARDIFAAMASAKQRWKRQFSLVLKVEQLDEQE